MPQLLLLVYGKCQTGFDAVMSALDASATYKRPGVRANTILAQIAAYAGFGIGEPLS